MSFFKKLKKGFKKIRKAVGLPAITLGNVAKVAGAAAVGGPAGLAGAVLKSKLKSAATGGLKQVLRTKGQKLLAKKLAQLAPSGPSAGHATTMPGGAPLATVGAQERRSQRRAAAIPYRRLKAAARARKATKGRRKPPTGGKDFKALAASWRAAGKPTSWQTWIKTH